MSTEEIGKYLQEPRGEAANRLERESLDDPFLYEALEGYHENPGAYRERLDSLYRRVALRSSGRTYRRTRRRWLRIAGSAAALLLLGGVSWLLITAPPVARETHLPLSEAVEVQSTPLPAKQQAAPLPAPADTVRSLPVKKTEKSQQVAQGIVVDEKGSPLSGVTVLVRGTTLGVATGSGGRFSLVLPDQTNRNLVFSFIGMQSVELAYTGQEELRVVLKEDRQALNEVVVTGYFSRKKELFTGSATTIPSERTGSVADVAGISDGLAACNAYLKKNPVSRQVVSGGTISFSVRTEGTPYRFRQDRVSRKTYRKLRKLLKDGPRWEASPGDECFRFKVEVEENATRYLQLVKP